MSDINKILAVIFYCHICLWIAIVFQEDIQAAYSQTAYFVGQEVTGQTRQCYYEWAGNRYTITVKLQDVCPTSIEVNDD